MNFTGNKTPCNSNLKTPKSRNKTQNNALQQTKVGFCITIKRFIEKLVAQGGWYNGIIPKIRMIKDNPTVETHTHTDIH